MISIKHLPCLLGIMLAQMIWTRCQRQALRAAHTAFRSASQRQPRPDRRVPKFLVVECLGFESPRGLKVYQQGRCAALRRAPSILINGRAAVSPPHSCHGEER